MRTHTPQSARTVVLALSLISLATMSAAVPIPVVSRDRFTDGLINQNLWDIHQVGGVSVSESNHRLQFAANGNTGLFSYAGLEVEAWGAKWRYDFEIEVDFKLNLANVTGNKEVLLGIGLALTGQYPENITGFAAGIFRDDVGLKLAIGRYSNGVVTASDITPVSVTQGQINLEWDRSDDRLTARIGSQEVHLTGAWAQFGTTMGNQPMIIAIGCTTTDGNITFPGTRVYLDEFKFEGVKKAR